MACGGVAYWEGPTVRNYEGAASFEPFTRLAGGEVAALVDLIRSLHQNKRSDILLIEQVP